MKLVIKEDILYTGGCLLCKVYPDEGTIDSRYLRDMDTEVLMAEGEISLEVPEGVEAIGPEAFSECPKLEEITLPRTLRAMESTALRSLRTVRVQASNPTYYMEGGFLMERREEGDRLLWVPEEQEVVKLPDCVYSIASGVFQYNFNLRAIYLPKFLTEVGPRQFRSCRKLQRVFLPPYLRVVAKDAFVNCDSLKVLVMENSLTFLTHDMKGEQAEGDAFEGVYDFHVFCEQNLWMTHYLDRHRCIQHYLHEAETIRELDNGPAEDREERIRRYLECLSQRKKLVENWIKTWEEK